MARQRLALVGAAALLAGALLAATAGSPAAGASTPAAVGAARSAPDVAQKKRLSACAKAKAALRKAKTKKAKAKAAARVKVACKKPKPKPTVKNVSLSLDTAKAATQTIGAAGGSVTATAADGTTYALALPKDALVGPTDVKVIPVKSVTGLGGHARVVGGVQFEPEGLALFKPATLTITASSLTGKPTQAFSWYGVGKTLGRYPSTRTGTQLELMITHFSGEGVAQGESSDWALWQGITDAMQAHYQQSTRPLMTRAETDDSVFVQAMQDYFGLWRQIQLLGLDESFTKELAGLAESAKKAFRNYVDKASERCVNQHKLGEIVTLLSAARQMALLGDQQQSDDALDKAKKCGHFELDFETVMTQTGGPILPGWSDIKAVSHVRVLGLPLAALEGGQPLKQLEYLSWSFLSMFTGARFTCTFSEDVIELGTPFRVTRLSGVLPTLKAVAGPDGRPQFDPPSISLSVDPGSPREWITSACSDGESNGRILWPTYSPGSGYAGVFDALYAAQSDGSSFRIDGWDFLGGSVYARKTYERSKAAPAQNQPFSTWTDDERTTYDLRHTPQ